MNAPGRFLIPLLLLFIVINGIVIAFDSKLQQNNINSDLLLYANGLFLVISLISFFIQKRGLQNKNPHGFVRTVMAAMMFKMIICIIAVIVYVKLSGEKFNKRGVFIALFFYLFYLATEVLSVMNMNKQRKTNV